MHLCCLVFWPFFFRKKICIIRSYMWSRNKNPEIMKCLLCFLLSILSIVESTFADTSMKNRLRAMFLQIDDCRENGLPGRASLLLRTWCCQSAWRPKVLAARPVPIRCQFMYPFKRNLVTISGIDLLRRFSIIRAFFHPKYTVVYPSSSTAEKGDICRILYMRMLVEIGQRIRISRKERPKDQELNEHYSNIDVVST